MKSKNLIMTVMLMALPSALMAQQNIKKAFDDLLNDNIVETKTHHSLERDPDTGKKISQADVYDFIVTKPAGLNHIKAIQKAFEKDNEAAYQMRTVSHPGTDHMSLAVGDRNSESIAIGKIKGSSYVYACFLDKDDPEKKHRYAYAMEWVEKDKKMQVRLAITYATTQQHREGKRKIKSLIINGNEFKMDENGFSFNNNGIPFDFSPVFGNDSISFNSERNSETWLSEFNIYKNLFQKKPNGNAASHFATSIYKLCKKAECLEKVEKNMVSKEIMKLKNKTNDDFIKELFDMSIERLKK